MILCDTVGAGFALALSLSFCEFPFLGVAMFVGSNAYSNSFRLAMASSNSGVWLAVGGSTTRPRGALSTDSGLLISSSPIDSGGVTNPTPSWLLSADVIVPLSWFIDPRYV